MVDMILEERVTDLEEAMAELARAQTITQTELTRLSQEMREFKDEMGEFKDRAEQSNIEMNRQWGQLANKMGTMVEDLVAPSLPRIVRQVTGCAEEEIEFMAIRVRRRLDNKRSREFDAVAVCGDYVLVNETKSSLDSRDIERFAKAMVTARDFMPEYSGRSFIGAIASLYVDNNLVRYGERRGLIVLGFGQNVMEVLNGPEFVPKKF